MSASDRDVGSWLNTGRSLADPLRQQGLLRLMDDLLPELAKASRGDLVTRDIARTQTVEFYTAQMRLHLAEAPEEVARTTCDVAVVCALHKPELDAVLATRCDWGSFRRPNDPTVYHAGSFKTAGSSSVRVVAAASSYMGMPAAAALASKMILSFRPRLISIIGIAAGAKRDSQGLGDILSPEYTFDHGSGRTSKKNGVVKFVPGYVPISVDSNLQNTLKEWSRTRRGLAKIARAWPGKAPGTDLRLHTGPIASGSAVLGETSHIEATKGHARKLIGVEMEAYAVHVAAVETVSPPPIFLCFKSVCDFAKKKNDVWQKYAAYTAAEFWHLFLSEEWEAVSGE